MSNPRHGMGQRGEQLAAHFLRQQGYEVLNVNVRTPYGELDLICRDGSVLVAVEVKTRRSHTFGLPEEAITLLKLTHIIHAMEHYIQSMDDAAVVEWRVDVVAIDLSLAGSASAIRHLQAVEHNGWQHP